MPAIVSLLRGVNLGKRRMKMEDLRALYVSLGLRDAQTYVQSGNVVFTTRERNPLRLAAKIEDAIEKGFGFHADVVLRTTSEMRSLMAASPFAGRKEIDPGKLLVVFLGSDPGVEARGAVVKIDCAPDELHAVGRELYIYFPNGQGRSQLKWPLVEKALKTTWTGRNWKTVSSLLAMAEALENKQ